MGEAHPTQSANGAEKTQQKLQGCARDGCLEVAKLGSERCPLHELGAGTRLAVEIPLDGEAR